MTRKSWIQINGELIPKDEYYGDSHSAKAPIFVPDIKPYKSTITGEIIGGRAQHKNHLKQHNLVEIGNEKVRPRPIPDVPGLREDLIRSIKRI